MEEGEYEDGPDPESPSPEEEPEPEENPEEVNKQSEVDKILLSGPSGEATDDVEKALL